MKVTCEIVKDMLPLYADGVVSDDTRKLVEDHMSECEECRKYYHSLKDDGIDDMIDKRMEEAESLKKIKHAILKKRIITGTVAALAVAVILLTAGYIGFVHERYVPYEDSGLVINEDTLTATKDYNGYYSIFSPDGETAFVYISDTMFSGHHKLDTPLEIMHYGKTFDTMIDDEGNETKVELKEVYYLPEEYAKTGKNGTKSIQFPDGEKESDKRVSELKEKSVLIWER